jgi:hypothetical protein
MIKNYNDFLINEAIIMINEAEVSFSNSFRKVLGDIDSDIARNILEIENNDIDIKHNFFDVEKDNNGLVSFLPVSKVEKMEEEIKNKVKFIGRNGGWLTFNRYDDNPPEGYEPNDFKNIKIFRKLGFEVPEDEVLRKPENGDIGEIIKTTVSDESGKTFAWVKFDNGIEIVINVSKLEDLKLEDSLWNNGRQQLKVGKAIRALLTKSNIKFTDSELEDFVNKYKNQIDKINDIFSNFEIVSGVNISHWYDYNNYVSSSKGTLGGSCMKDVDADFFDIYVNNKKCEMVILKNDKGDLIKGRALLWKINNGRKFMDRIYTNYDSDINLFLEYADKMDFLRKVEQSYKDTDYVIDKNGQKYHNVYVQLDDTDFSLYPYLDTFKYLYKNRDILSCNKQFGDNYNLLDSTDGYLECGVCGGSGETDCYECHGSGEIECGECRGTGDIDCSYCDASGEIECDECNGEGCDECDGSGQVECDGCDGSGQFECEECRGSGEIECPECYRGQVNCYECT